MVHERQGSAYEFTRWIWGGGQKGAPREVSAAGLDRGTVSLSLLLSLSLDSFGCSTCV